MDEFCPGLWAFLKKRKQLVLGLNLVSVGIVCVALIICGIHGCSGGSSSPTTPAVSPPVAAPQTAFPLIASADHRYWQDQNGAPFPILGRV